MVLTKVKEETMKRLDDGKTSLVDFMRSIRHMHHHTTESHDDLSEHFAELVPQTRSPQTRSPKKHTGKNQKQEEKR
jgi:hypothetical protein